MKKILFSIACMVGIVLAMTSCSSGDDHYYYYSNLTGIYTSESANDTSTVMLMPNGSKDMIMIQYQDGNTKDSIFITPTVNLDDQQNVGSFKEGDWTGEFSFTERGDKAQLTMTNQKTGKQLPVISLTKSHFGHTLAGSWSGTDSAGKSSSMSIWLCRPGFADRGYITIDGVKHNVLVYGPSSKYGNGNMLIYDDSRGGWYWALYQLSALTADYNQYIVIYRDGQKYIEMSRLIGNSPE